ncbi:tRNA-dihydrouridine synthase, partial [Aliiglaciecola sp.]|nr:tRNA-dihydrouridine synthase [Aliiglaciecola sp.]
MKIVLAPMEGVVDHLMRDMLTQVGGFDHCVTEFVRVVDQLLPQRVYYRLCPELKTGGYTPSGIPVKVQLLGQEPDWLAENAVRAIELGSHGVDLNFGCPAKTVNKSKGGAVLLREPDALYRIVSAVRDAVPVGHQVTAKMRLGFEDKMLAVENALAIESAGADSLAIHARTKVEGYKPPAYWDHIARIKQHTKIP